MALAVALGATLFGATESDTLCPEHRAWVINFAFGTFATGVAAVIRLARRRPGGAVLALSASLAGVAVGVIDTAHSATRGHLVAAGFAAVAAVACAIVVAQQRLARFDRWVVGVAAPHDAAPDTLARATIAVEAERTTTPKVPLP